MIRKLSESMVKWQISKSILSEDDRALYEYAYIMLIGQAINFLIAGIIAIIFRSVIPVIVFLLSYIPLRTYAGGYHAKNSERCTIVSAGILCMVCLITKRLDFSSNIFLITGLGIVAVIIIFILSPVEDINKPLEEIERKRYSFRARLILMLEIVISMVSYYIGLKLVYVVIVLSHIILAVMLCIGKGRVSIFHDRLKSVN
jgi:accessory gene regulator B